MIGGMWLATYTLAVSIAYAIAALFFPEYAVHALFLVVPAIVIPEVICEARGYAKRARERAKHSQREISY